MATAIPQGIAGIKDSADVMLISRKTGKPVLTIDYANTFSISLSSESVSARKKGQDAITWANPKEGTITLGVEMLNGSLISMLLGSPVLNKMVDFYKREVFDITSADQAVDLKGTPKSGSVTAFKVREDGVTHISEIASPEILAKRVTLTGVVEGDKVCVYYLTEEQANTFSIAGKRLLTEDYRLIAVTTTKLYENGDEVPIELEATKVSPEENIELSFDAENPSSFEIAFKMMVDENDEMLKWKEIPVE